MTTLKEFGFEDIKVIGRGQYGKAHLVRNEQDQAYFIAKTIDLTCLSSKERETALQEVALLRRLDHPNIVEYKDNFFMSDTLVIIMQYCEGGDLQTYIKEKFKQKQRIREEQIMHYFVQVLQALQYIHVERILHRDLKTSNLFLMKSKQVVKLGDFGISRVLEGSIEAAITVVGTPYYMSPEVCENKPYTFKSDVWSLGCVLYELCMLKHAFSADNLLGLVYKIVSDKYEPIPKMYTPNLNGLIQRMLEKDAEKRPSVRELLADPYVHDFMNKYVRTRGQCATPSASSAATGLRHSAGGSGSGTPSTQSRGSATGAAAGGGGGGGGAAAHAASRGSGARSPGSEAAAAPPDGAAATAAPPQRPPRPKPARREAAPSRSAGGGGGGGGGHAAGGAAAVGAARRAHETPKEAALRRKREAADRQAAELKAAARQAGHNKLVARQMKETEFQSTRLGPSAMSAAAAASATRGSGAGSQSPSSPSGACMEPLQGSGRSDDSSGSVTPEDECLDSPIEEISEEDDYSEDGTEYEEDFVSEESVSEEEEAEEAAPQAGGDSYYGAASAVREEQDFTRIMANYEQDISRTRGGTSPPPRRAGGASPPAAAASPPPAAAAAVASPPAASAGGGRPGAAIMDMRSRAEKLREELMHKMGAETFQKAFNYLSQARQKNVDERTVRRELEALVGKETYKRFCFDVDQLVFQQIVYS